MQGTPKSPSSVVSNISDPRESVGGSPRESRLENPFRFDPRTPPVLSMRAHPNFNAETLLYALSKSNLVLEMSDDSEGGSEKGDEKQASSHSTPTVVLKASFRGLDGGYAWVVTLGAFISMMIEGAFERGEGILYQFFLQRFKQSNQLTTIPTAMASTLRFLLSPVASIICNRYSIRASVMCGALLFSCGVFLTQFATNLYELFFFYGVLGGCGRALFSGPGLIVIGLYFRNRQGLATGITLSGVGFGAFLLVPLMEFLLNHYGYQGAFLIFSGIALNMTVVALLYRPLSTNNRFLALAAKEKMRAYLKKQQSQEKGQTKTVVGDEVLTHFKEEMTRAGVLSTRISDDSMALPFRVTVNGQLETVPSRSVVSHSPRRFKRAKAVLCDNDCCQILFPVEDFNAEPSERHAKESNSPLQLLSNKAFMFYCFSTFFFVSSFKIVFVFLPTLLQGQGSSLKDASYLLSINGLLDIVSRIGFGLLIDTAVMRPRRIPAYIWMLLVMAVAVLALPFMGTLLRTFLAFTTYSVGAGFCLTSRTVLLVELIGVRKLPSAFGILMCMMGFGSLIGPPVAGFLLDVYGSILYGYYFASACAAASAVCMMGSLSFHKLAPHRQSEAHH